MTDAQQPAASGTEAMRSLIGYYGNKLAEEATIELDDLIAERDMLKADLSDLRELWSERLKAPDDESRREINVTTDEILSQRTGGLRVIAHASRPADQ